MCDVVVIDGDDRKEIETAGGLSDELSVPIALLAGCAFEPSKDQCLCTVDVMAMAEAANRGCRDVQKDWKEWAFVSHVIEAKKNTQIE